MRAILCLLATGILLTVTSATSAEPPENPDPGTGALLAKMNGVLVPMPVVAMEVSLSISGPIVRGRVVQTFTNPTAETLEAEYVFPLPGGAAVDGLMLEVGDRRFVGEIHEKEEARRTYENAKAEGKGAGLVEQDRPNIFRTRVANIPPHASIVVHLDTLEEAEWSEGWFQTTFPTTITARYAPSDQASCELISQGPCADRPSTRRSAKVPFRRIVTSCSVGNRRSNALQSPADWSKRARTAGTASRCSFLRN